MFLFLKCMHAVRIASFIILNGTHQLKSLKGYWHYIWANYFYLENYTYSSSVILSYQAWCFSLPPAYICWARTGNICITFLFIWWASESNLGLLNCSWTLGNHMWHCVVWTTFKARGFVWAGNVHHCSTYACAQEGWEWERRPTAFPKYKSTGKSVFPDGLYREKTSRAGAFYYIPWLNGPGSNGGTCSPWLGLELALLLASPCDPRKYSDKSTLWGKWHIPHRWGNSCGWGGVVPGCNVCCHFKKKLKPWCVKGKGYFKEGLDSRIWTEDFWASGCLCFC